MTLSTSDADAPERIHLSLADITEVEERYVLDALRSGWVAPLGPHVDAFEREIAERVGVLHALALSSGTAALHLGLIALGAGPGKVVVLPSMTFVASANAVTYTGAEPVFVDSRPSDGNVDPELLLDTVDDLRREGADIAAVMTVDLFGRTTDYSVIEAGLAEREIPLLEDAAESLGASHRGRMAGSFGSAAALSFNGNKIMTTSGGGMLLSNDPKLLEHARKLSTQSREPVPWYEHSETGYNYRLSNILAALGRGQLSRLDEMIARRREIRRRYTEGLAGHGVMMLGGDDSSEDNCWLTCALLPDGVSSTPVVSAMNTQAIEARHLWKPMHLQPLFRDARYVTNGTSQALYQRGLTLPSGSAMTADEQQRVIETACDFLALA